MARVAVIIPTYNRAHLVGKTIESVLAQAYQDFVIIVVDDGSTDNTEQVVQSYGEKVRFLPQPRRGSSAATRNAGILASDSEYLAFVDSDDLWCPEKLEQQVAFLDDHAEYDLVFGDAGFIDPSGAPDRIGWTHYSWMQWNGEETASAMFLCPFIPSPAPLVRRSAVVGVGMFDEQLINHEDLDLYLRIAATGKIKGFPDIVGMKRTGPGRKRYEEPGYSRRQIQQRVNRLTSQVRMLEKFHDTYPDQFQAAGSAGRRKLSTANLHLGMSLHDAGDRRQALKYLMRSLTLTPRNPQVYLRFPLLVLPGSQMTRLSEFYRRKRCSVDGGHGNAHSVSAS